MGEVMLAYQIYDLVAIVAYHELRKYVVGLDYM